MENKKKLGKKIKELRKKKGLTQEKLAELVDLEQNSISVIESGRNFPTLATLEKIANKLDADLNEFFNYEYYEDIELIKQTMHNYVESLNESQIRQIYRYIKNVIF